MLTDVTVTVVGTQLASAVALGWLEVEYSGMPEWLGAGLPPAVPEAMDLASAVSEPAGPALGVPLPKVMVWVVIDVTEVVEKREGIAGEFDTADSVGQAPIALSALASFVIIVIVILTGSRRVRAAHLARRRLVAAAATRNEAIGAGRTRWSGSCGKDGRRIEEKEYEAHEEHVERESNHCGWLMVRSG